MTATEISSVALAPRIRALLESADLEALAEVLDPDVHWGAPDDPDQSCQNRQDVIAWWARARGAGVRAKVTETEVIGDQVLVGLHVTGRPGGEGNGDRWQVLTVGASGVVEIVGFDNRDDALARTAAAGTE